MRALGRLRDNSIELFHLGCATDDIAEPLTRFDSLAQHAVFSFQPQVPGHTFQQQPEFFHAERLRDVIVGPVLHRLHRRLNRTEAGDHDHQRFGPILSDAMQRV